MCVLVHPRQAQQRRLGEQQELAARRVRGDALELGQAPLRRHDERESGCRRGSRPPPSRGPGHRGGGGSGGRPRRRPARSPGPRAAPRRRGAAPSSARRPRRSAGRPLPRAPPDLLIAPRTGTRTLRRADAAKATPCTRVVFRSTRRRDSRRTTRGSARAAARGSSSSSAASTRSPGEKPLPQHGAPAQARLGLRFRAGRARRAPARAPGRSSRRGPDSVRRCRTRTRTTRPSGARSTRTSCSFATCTPGGIRVGRKATRAVRGTRVSSGAVGDGSSAPWDRAASATPGAASAATASATRTRLTAPG